MKIPSNTKVACHQCPSCPFLETGLKLGTERMAQIQQYLLEGTNHFCHSDVSNHTICRGGRNHQLTMWHRIGFIAEPTDEALKSAMEKVGVEPKEHI